MKKILIIINNMSYIDIINLSLSEIIGDFNLKNFAIYPV